MILSKFSVEDRVAIVTGSGRGLGKGIALGLAEAGANIVVVARTATEIEETAAEIRKIGRKALAVPADVRESDQIENMVQKTLEEFGRIDILVNNAGGSFRARALEMSGNAWDAIVRVNLKSVFLCSKAAGKVMLDQKKGSIVNISSAAGRWGSVGMPAYGASKAGIINLTQTLASDWAPYVRVNGVAPSVIETPGMRWSRGQAGKDFGSISEQIEAVIKDTPLGRLGQPEDVAAAVLFLASDAADWVTGITLDVTGGRIVR
ncbi:SDR family NAD(P)-dependent oxidoreductase [Chloroflexota bacterium]